MKTPVAISGLGGSGTRVFADLIRQFGYHIGEDLGPALDNLWWTLLFKRRSVIDESSAVLTSLYRVFRDRMAGNAVSAHAPVAEQIRELAATGRLQHSAPWLQERAQHFLDPPSQAPVDQMWGWKEPNTHILANFLLDQDPELKLIHIVRDPIYMSFSSNQRQLSFWGPSVFGSDVEVTPAMSLAFWCQVHRRLEALASQFPRRLIFMSYDFACAHREVAIDCFAELLDVDLSPSSRSKALASISLDRSRSASDEQRSYPFEESDRHWATGFIDRQFGSPASRLFLPR